MPELNEITLFAKTNFRNREVSFGIRRDDRRRHMYVIGKTGMGKTTLIENMVIQDILNGEGVAFVDPHGDSVEKVLSYIPSNRINDVVYLNPSDTDYPIAFNPLEAVDTKYKHLVASGLMGVFTKIWAGVWSPRMEYILNNTILALLDSPGNTMLGIARMLVNKTYRKRIVDNIKDPVVKSFWVDEFANYNDKFRTEAIAPIQNKVGQFLSSAIIRNIVGQTKSTIDLREIMDDRKILLLNLSKGRIGEDSSALLGAMIITKLQLAAMSRVDIPEEDRKDFYLYVDEFQNFATESFANILSEARKYRLNLIVAHQYIGQLVNDRNTVVRDAIFGNVGTMVTFRVGADDAEFLEKEFEPTYTMNDLVNLAKYNIYLKLMINGMSSKPFSATTLPPISHPTGNIDKVIKVSRERYGTPRPTVEEKISKWLGAEYHADAARVESSSVDEEGAEENFRFKDVPQAPQATQAPALPKETAVAPPPPVAKAPEPQPVVSKAEKSAAKHDRRKDDVKAERTEHKDKSHRREIERRTRQTDSHPHRRASDKHQEKNVQKSKAENPVWDTVSKLSADKVKEKAEKTAAALESLGKTLEQALKTPIKDKNLKEIVLEEPGPGSSMKREIKLPPVATPQGNPQSSLTTVKTDDEEVVEKALKQDPKLSKLKPGEKITFE
ncbi:MAG TPA: type IV secretion system DNA-binding domain-containing protein [Verrucomicrobiae bacterium]|nr:type IV secretion system DNA-binding domain-containing protein [Verrucomicrobiae bacterium]